MDRYEVVGLLPLWIQAALVAGLDVLLSLLLFSRRAVQPVKARRPLLVIFSNLATGALVLLFVGLHSIPVPPGMQPRNRVLCYRALVFFLVLALSQITFVIRAFVFWFEFSVVSERVTLNKNRITVVGSPRPVVPPSGPSFSLSGFGRIAVGSEVSKHSESVSTFEVELSGSKRALIKEKGHFNYHGAVDSGLEEGKNSRATSRNSLPMINSAKGLTDSLLEASHLDSEFPEVKRPERSKALTSSASSPFPSKSLKASIADWKKLASEAVEKRKTLVEIDSAGMEEVGASFETPLGFPTRAEFDVERLWFTHHKYLIGRRFIAAVFIFFILVPAVILLVVAVADCNLAVLAGVGNTVLLIFIIAQAVFAFLLKNQFDFFWLRYEILFSSLNEVFTYILLGIFQIPLLTYIEESIYGVVAQIIIFYLFSQLVINSCVPLYLTLNTRENPRSRTSFNGDLRSLLTSKIGFEAFEKFLIGESSVENLYFYREVVLFRKQCRALSNSAISARKVREALDAALNIRDVYFDKKSPFEINISSEIRDHALKNLKSFVVAIEEISDATLTATDYVTILKKLREVFEESRTETFRLMENDSYLRFRKSNLFKEVEQTFLEFKKAKDAMKELNLV